MKVFIYCRYPEKGKVKTRIAQECGDENALALYERMLKTVFKNIEESGFHFTVHYTGCDEKKASSWLAGYEFKKQSSGDLGVKLKNSIRQWFENNDESLVIIGSDQIEVDRTVLEETAEKLKNNDIVLGPAEDGGYYLIGLSGPHLQLFDNISWGTESVLQETLNKILESGLSYFLLSEKNDIDYLSDVPEEWKRELMLDENND